MTICKVKGCKGTPHEELHGYCNTHYGIWHTQNITLKRQTPKHWKNRRMRLAEL